MSAVRACAVAYLCAGEEELELQFTSAPRGFLSFADGGVAKTPAARLQPAT